MTPPASAPSAPPAAASLPASRLVIVTGKGGVGRSSTATAIAAALAGSGRRVALVHPVDAPAVLPPEGLPHAPQVVALDRDEAMSNYLSDQLPGPFAAALRASRAFRLVTAATPGLAELLTIGELMRLAERFDHLVFDAPATGHLLALFDAPGRFERAAVAGPVARRSAQLGAWITDPAGTSLVTVTTGDGLAVSEMLELVGTLATRLSRPPALVIANRLAPASPAPAELAANAAGPFDPHVTALVDRMAARARSERAQLGRVTRQLGSAPIRALERPGDGVGAILQALPEGPAA